ncbi:uncharacterized protein LOC131538388 isoform X2 [Onychostoma macrolepis]|nr:uncharacterized protein LOC131538388 isoform X2 [Onychostoma macrolepis]
MTCVFDSGKTRNLTTPSELRKLASAARCKIHKTKGFHMSCYHDGKPICCDTPCECDLNLLNATCTMQDKSMECSCAGSASADDPVLHSCFKNLHKTSSRACDIKAGDTCYISTGATDGKEQERKSKQVSDEDKKERKDNNVTPKPDNQPSANNNTFWISISGISGISFIGGIVLGIFLSWLCCYLNRKYSICGSCSENQKKLDHKRKKVFRRIKIKSQKQRMTRRTQKKIEKKNVTHFFHNMNSQTGRRTCSTGFLQLQNQKLLAAQTEIGL